MKILDVFKNPLLGGAGFSKIILTKFNGAICIENGFNFNTKKARTKKHRLRIFNKSFIYFLTEVEIVVPLIVAGNF